MVVEEIMSMLLDASVESLSRSYRYLTGEDFEGDEPITPETLRPILEAKGQEDLEDAALEITRYTAKRNTPLIVDMSGGVPTVGGYLREIVATMSAESAFLDEAKRLEAERTSPPRRHVPRLGGPRNSNA